MHSFSLISREIAKNGDRLHTFKKFSEALLLRKGLSTRIASQSGNVCQCRALSTSAFMSALNRPSQKELFAKAKKHREKFRHHFQERSKVFRKRIDDVKDKIMTIPNVICIFRIGCTPLIGYLVVTEHFIPANILLILAALSDMLDGYIARTYPGQKSLLGSMLDPVADKFLITTLFVTLSYSQLIPVLLTTIIITRDVLLVIGGFIRRYQLLERPVTLKRFFDPSVSSVKVKPTLVSKINTGLQLLLIASSLASPVLGFENHSALKALCVITAGTTVFSGLQYARGRAMIPVKEIRLWKKK
ncbi:CDP-alcohol phosphatidyltransferase domain-containing protein [Ditylenchus destructor]|nr:CDP-alcohol phosphatidyltransferase domain-containing protein [Ditylenchus destructor]